MGCCISPVSSSARAATTGDMQHPIYISRGKGSRIWDVDGNEFIDYLLSYGSAVLGHADPELNSAISAQLSDGTMFGTCNTAEVELAEQICRMSPCAELVRFANSGSEAICGAVRAARGVTGREKVLKFEGHYHGWVDVLAISNRPSRHDCGPADEPHAHPHSLGLPRGVASDVVVAPWNDIEALRRILDRHKGELAAIVAEPIVANNACIMPGDGYLSRLREECDQRGIVLIFDEIVTGFRTAPGGAQELFDIQSDIAVFSKALGGGLPISAFAGKRKIMDAVAANTVKHGGTYNGNPLCAVAALHTLRTLAREDVQESIRSCGETIMEGIRRSAADNKIPCVVQGLGSMFQVVFMSDAPRNYRDLWKADTALFSRFRHGLLENGVHINNGPLACWFVTAAHQIEETAITVAAIDTVMRGLA